MDIITMARELGKAIQQDETYTKYQAAQKAADEDKVLQDLIGEFNLRRIELSQEMNKVGDQKDQNKIDALDAQLREQFQKAMAHPTMAEYNICKQEMDAKMSFINQILSASVNGEDPDSVEESSCTGSCSSCGGCH